MNRIHSHLQEVNIIGKLADLKSDHYEHSLMITALTDLLIENNIITRDQLAAKINQLDAAVDTFIRDSDHPIR